MKEIDIIKKGFKQNWFKRLFSENIVIEHKNFFYKTPNISWKYLFHKWKCPYKSIKKDYNLIKQIFWNDFIVVNTKIIKDIDITYIIKQKKITWKILSNKDLNNNKIKNKLLLILYLNKKLWKEKWVFLDILWTDALYSPFKLHNLMIKDGTIYIFDFWFLNKNSYSFTFKIFSIFFYYLQLFWIEKILLRR